MKYLITCLLIACCSLLQAQESKSADGKVVDKKAEGKSVTMELGGGKLVLKSPKEWNPVAPRFSMIQYEFGYPATAKAGEAPVRITVMGATGGIQANIDRWYDQFKQPDGKATKDVAKVEESEVAGKKLYVVKTTGTYADSMRPGAKPGDKKENQMLIGAIIEAKDAGTFFIKMVGPKEDCEKLDEGFMKMLKEMEAK